MDGRMHGHLVPSSGLAGGFWRFFSGLLGARRRRCRALLESGMSGKDEIQRRIAVSANNAQRPLGDGQGQGDNRYRIKWESGQAHAIQGQSDAI